MKIYEATEQAYKNGYEKGKADALDKIQKPRFLLKDNGDIVPLTNWQQWIPVTERLPDANRYVLCFVLLDGGYEGQCIKTTFHYGNGRFIKDKPTDRITHWMPLPEPPKE